MEGMRAPALMRPSSRWSPGLRSDAWIGQAARCDIEPLLSSVRALKLPAYGTVRPRRSISFPAQTRSSLKLIASPLTDSKRQDPCEAYAAHPDSVQPLEGSRPHAGPLCPTAAIIRRANMAVKRTLKWSSCAGLGRAACLTSTKANIEPCGAILRDGLLPAKKAEDEHVCSSSATRREWSCTLTSACHKDETNLGGGGLQQWGLQELVCADPRAGDIPMC